MKPNFALSLSYDGIVLLHRVGSGWSMVGEVPLDAPDLASQLAVLRKTGLALDSAGLRCKVLIPNDQIKYLALDTTRAAEDDIRRALAGATPYAVDDLAYDYVRGGGRTYIAAVARETLAEAEAFAAEHRFGPVCFAGVPEPFTYVGEAYFGVAAGAQRLLEPGQQVERDEVAVSLLPKARPAPAKLPLPVAPNTALPLDSDAPSVSAGPVPPQDQTDAPVAEPPLLSHDPNLPLLAAAGTAAGLPPVEPPERARPEPDAMTVAAAKDAPTDLQVEATSAAPAPRAAPDTPPAAAPLLLGPSVPDAVDLADHTPDAPMADLADHTDMTLEKAQDEAREFGEAPIALDVPDTTSEATSPDAPKASTAPQEQQDSVAMDALPRSEPDAAPREMSGQTEPELSQGDAARNLSTPDLPNPGLSAPDLPTPDLPVPDLPVHDVQKPDDPAPDLNRMNGHGHAIAAPVRAEPALPVPVGAAVTGPDIPDEPGARVPLVPEPMFASRARPLRAEPADPAAPMRPLAPPPGAKVVRADDRTEPMFSRRVDPAVTSGATARQQATGSLALAGQPARPNPVPPPPAFGGLNGPAGGGMNPPRLTGAARNTPDSSGMPAPVTLAQATGVAAAVTGIPATARPAATVAATIIPFRPLTDPDSGPAATPVSIETVTLTQPRLVKAPAAPVVAPVTLAEAGTVPAPALQPGKSGYFASRHGKTDLPPPKPQIAPFKERGEIGGKPRFLGLILTLVLLACLAAVAFWASFISETGIAGLFGHGAETTVAADSDGNQALETPAITGSALTPPDTATVTSLPEGETETAPEVTATLPDPAPEVPDISTGPEAQDTALASAETPAPEIDAAAALLAEPAPADPAAETQTAAAPAEPATVPAAVATGIIVSPAEADRFYAATGVWLRAPRLPLVPTSDPLGDISVAALDTGADRLALPALPPLAGASPDQAILPQLDPPPPGTVFARDDRGFVLATPEGTLTAAGILVFAGQPGVIPPSRPGSEVAVVAPVPAEVAPVEEAPVEVAAVSAPPLAPRDQLAPPQVAGTVDPLADPAVVPDPATAGGVGLASLGPLVRPLLRPETLAPDISAPAADIAALPAFAGPRAPLRPESLTPQTEAAALAAAQPVPVEPADPIADPSLAVADTVAAILAAAPPDALATATALAIASARVPETRPQNFAAVVASAQERNASAETPANASLAVITPEVQVAPDVVAPSGPISGDVATAATLEESIDLRAINLIGVFGRPNDRRALVRLGNGRYVRVGVGDSLDGGQVAAIGDNALNYVKRGQTITIAIPNG